MQLNSWPAVGPQSLQIMLRLVFERASIKHNIAKLATFIERCQIFHQGGQLPSIVPTNTQILLNPYLCCCVKLTLIPVKADLQRGEMSHEGAEDLPSPKEAKVDSKTPTSVKAPVEDPAQPSRVKPEAELAPEEELAQSHHSREPQVATIIRVHIDGSFRFGHGGWGMCSEGDEIYPQGGTIPYCRSNTNNTAEVYAAYRAIEAVRALPRETICIIYTDSQFLLDRLEWGPTYFKTDAMSIIYLSKIREGLFKCHGSSIRVNFRAIRNPRDQHHDQADLLAYVGACGSSNSKGRSNHLH